MGTAQLQAIPAAAASTLAHTELNIKSRGPALKRQPISPNTFQRVHTFCIACSLPELAPPIVRRNEYAQSACKQVFVNCPGTKHWTQDVSGYPGCEPQLPSEAAFSCLQKLPSAAFRSCLQLPSEAAFSCLQKLPSEAAFSCPQKLHWNEQVHERLEEVLLVDAGFQ